MGTLCLGFLVLAARGTSSSESDSDFARLMGLDVLGFARARGTSSSESSFLTWDFFFTAGEEEALLVAEGDDLGFDFAARGTSSSESEAGALIFGFFGDLGFDLDNRCPNGASSSELSDELGGVFRFAAPY